MTVSQSAIDIRADSGLGDSSFLFFVCIISRTPFPPSCPPFSHPVSLFFLIYPIFPLDYPSSFNWLEPLYSFLVLMIGQVLIDLFHASRRS